MKNDVVTIHCYKKVEKMNRKDAIKEFYEGMLYCDGSEQERYANIYGQLMEGITECYDII